MNDCNKVCDKKLDPICLNGDRQYSNKCVMDVIVCQNNITVLDWKKGYCDEDDGGNSGGAAPRAGMDPSDCPKVRISFPNRKQ